MPFRLHLLLGVLQIAAACSYVVSPAGAVTTLAVGATIPIIAILHAGWALYQSRRDSISLNRLALALECNDSLPLAPCDLARPDPVGNIARALVVHRLELDHKRASAREVELALRHDALTGLLGRQAFDELLTAAIEKPDGLEMGLLTLDLDRFKEINDTSGHAGGDAILKKVAVVLQNVCGENEIVGRLGGDEFAIIHRSRFGKIGTRSLAQTVLDAFAKEGIGASIGVALYPSDATEEARLRHYSDLALYEAKNEGRGRVCFFSSRGGRSRGKALSFVPLPSELRDAIASNQLVLHYQPKVHARTGQIDSVEALVRWRHPERGMIPPDTFIPVAEKMGHIRALTEWTLRQATEDQRVLDRAGYSFTSFVNISACLLADPLFANTALEIILAKIGSIGFEITETAVIKDPENALANLQQLVDAGISIAIDDYGVGMSSLAYLKRLPARELKIDRAFIAELSSSHRDPLIVRSTIDLAHALGLLVTAEGVEKQASFSLLKAMGCDLIQGYFVARPMPLEGLLLFLGDNQALDHLSRVQSLRTSDRLTGL